MSFTIQQMSAEAYKNIKPEHNVMYWLDNGEIILRTERYSGDIVYVTEIPAALESDKIYVDTETGEMFIYTNQIEYLNFNEADQEYKAWSIAEYSGRKKFPLEGKSNVMYIDKNLNEIYRWSSNFNKYEALANKIENVDIIESTIELIL